MAKAFSWTIFLKKNPPWLKHYLGLFFWKKSTMVKALSWTIFWKNPPWIFNKILIQTIRWPWNWFYILFPKQDFNPLCSMTRFIIVLKNGFVITKPIFYQWNEKIIQDFNVPTSIDCWCNDNHISWIFKRHANPYYEWLGKFPYFLLAIIFICFLWMAPDKSLNIITRANVDSWFIILFNLLYLRNILWS